MNTTNQQGFTAIELLITLVIASMFIFSGFQLYTQVKRDGADANRAAVLSGVVLNKVQKAASDAGSSTCAGSGPTSVVNTNESGFGRVEYITTISCPSPVELPTLKYIKVTAKYDNNPVKEITHGTYSK